MNLPPTSPEPKNVLSVVSISEPKPAVSGAPSSEPTLELAVVPSSRQKLETSLVASSKPEESAAKQLTAGTAELLGLLGAKGDEKRKAKKVADNTGGGKRPRVEPPEPPAVATGCKMPYMTVERSRGRFTCRTGLGGPGSSRKIPYGPTHRQP